MDCGISLGLNKWALTSGLGLLSLGGYETYQFAIKPVETAKHFSIKPLALKTPEEPKVVSEVKEKEIKPTVVENKSEAKKTVVKPETKPKPNNKPATHVNWSNSNYVGIYQVRSYLARIR